MSEITVTDKEHDQIVAAVWDECARIYDMEGKVSRNLVAWDLPWETCSFCHERHRCVVDLREGSCECAACRFKRRVAEEKQKVIDNKIAYRKEQLKDFDKI